MKRAGVIALAVMMILAGCPADGGSEQTVTPAAVPAMPTTTPTPDSGFLTTCDVPRPVFAERSTPEPLASPATIPTEDGTVNASAVVATHEATIAKYRYRLTGTGLSVVATRNQSAFLATVGSNASSVSHYAINGTRYTYFVENRGRQHYSVGQHPPERSTVFGGSLSLTGGATVERILRTYPHRIETVRDDGWTVLNGTTDEPRIVGDREVLHVNSTVMIDSRGIVREVRTRSVYRSRGLDDGSRRTENVSMLVSQVGEATFERPDWACIAAPERQ